MLVPPVATLTHRPPHPFRLYPYWQVSACIQYRARSARKASVFVTGRNGGSALPSDAGTLGLRPPSHPMFSERSTSSSLPTNFSESNREGNFGTQTRDTLLECICDDAASRGVDVEEGIWPGNTRSRDLAHLGRALFHHYTTQRRRFGGLPAIHDVSAAWLLPDGDTYQHTAPLVRSVDRREEYCKPNLTLIGSLVY